MKKKLATGAVLAAVLLLGGAAAALADPFDPAGGTATIMVSGGTLYEDHTTAAQGISGGGATVATVILPAGRYEVAGKAWAENGTTAPNFVQCGLVGLTENARATLPAAGFATLAVLGSVEATEGTEVEMFCNADSLATVGFVVLQATTVSAIVAQ